MKLPNIWLALPDLGTIKTKFAVSKPKNWAELSIGTVNSTFLKIIEVMYSKLRFWIKWPDRESIWKTLPPAFKTSFPKLTSIVRLLIASKFSSSVQKIWKPEHRYILTIRNTVLLNFCYCVVHLGQLLSFLTRWVAELQICR